MVQYRVYVFQLAGIICMICGLGSILYAGEEGVS